MVKEIVEKVTSKEMATAIKAMRSGKAARSCEVCAGIVSASGEVEISADG